MRIVFMGTPSYATEILKEIINKKEYEIVGLFTQMDKPVGRKKVLTPPDIKKFVLQEKCKFPVFQPKTLRDEKVCEDIKNLNPDFIIVAAFGQILPKEVLEIATCINLHASLLPKFRGASPIQNAILQNNAFSGITAMKMDEGLDTGEMVGFSYVQMKEDFKSDELFEILAKSAAKLTIKVLEYYKNLEPIKQINSISSHTKKISKSDGEVCVYKMKAAQIDRKFRAFYPWPGIFLTNGLKLLDIEYIKENAKLEAGCIEEIRKDGIFVSCKEEILKINQVQAPSKSKIDAYSYIVGQRKKIGDKLY